MARADSKSWNLESFLDSLVIELDKAQDTLAVKGVNRPLSYSVKELSLDLHVFPTFDGKAVKFRAAESGDTGASKISFQLGSITSEQIRRTTARPITRDDLSIEEVEGLDEDVKRSLRKHGVTSTRDLKSLEERNVDLDEVLRDQPEHKKTSYKNLANIINKARRQRLSPRVSQVSLAKQAGATVLEIEGSNLAVVDNPDVFPVAALDGKKVPVIGASDRHIQVQVDPQQLRTPATQLQIALDPFAVVTMNLKSSPNAQEISNDSEQI